MIVTVGLLPLVSTTVNAVSYDDYIYTTAVTISTGETLVFISTDYPTVWADTKSSTDVSDAEGIYIFDMDGGTAYIDPVIQLVYNEGLQSWVCYQVIEPYDGSATMYRFGTSTARAKSYQRVQLTSERPTQVITNYGSWNSSEVSYAQNYSTDLEQLPHGLDDATIRDIISESINTQTAVGDTATTIINNTTTQYNSYQAGDITSAEMQSYVSTNLDTLSELTPSTLLDAMQINNALTYNQAIQDELLNTSSDTVAAKLASALNSCNTAVNNYTQGNIDQRSATQAIRYKILEISRLLTDGTVTTAADIAAVNAAINAMQVHLDQVTGYSDVSQDVSDKSQASDAEELALLDEMVTAMQAEELENPMQDQQTMSDAVTVRDSIADIWVNKYMLALTAMFGMLVIPCIILRTHYRMM